LLDAGVITNEQLTEALAEQKASNKRLGQILIEKGFISEEKLMEVLAEQLGVEKVNLYNYNIDPSVATSIPTYLAQRYQVIPIEKREGKVILAMADPLNIIALDDVAMVTGAEVVPVIASETAVAHAINQFYGLKESLELTSEERQSKAEEEAELARIKAAVEDAPIVKVVNTLIMQAVNEGASDIHIEPTEKGVRVRLRIDGVLFDFMSPPKETQPLIVSRIKIMSNLDIAERRLPQDGRIQMQVGLKEVNMRVSTMPTIYGEKVVIRILERERVVLPLENVGFSQQNYETFRKFIRHSSGMILVTGPTGCGKTTTLYSALNFLSNPEKNIITVEDPVEYRLEGVNQIQVNPRINLSFANALRHILRQDPDIIMVGEIRDLETAEIAIRAALTGHLVLSTLHTNDAPRAVTRLVDMGVEGFLVNACLVGVVAQRLVRRICNECREEYALSREEKDVFQSVFKQPAPEKLFKGAGCNKCNNTGYRGRMAIHEMLVMTPEIRQLVADEESGDKIRETALAQGMVPLLMDGLARVREGLTTMQEVIRVAFAEF